MGAEFEVSSFIADVIVERRAAAYRIWRKRRDELGEVNEFIRSYTGTIRSIAQELLKENDLTWARDEEAAREELERLAK